MSLPLIALAEDDLMQRASVERALRNLTKISHYPSAEALLADPLMGMFKLIILDWGLPQMSGIDALKKLRVYSDVPVLFLTSRTAEVDLVEALALGADDFLSKPFRTAELQARVSVLLRRGALSSQRGDSVQKPLWEGVSVDEKLGSLQIGTEAPVLLYGKELDLSITFFKHVGEPLSREYLMRTVWGHGDELPSRTLDTHVSKIRTKLNLRPEMGWRLAPVYSFGYRLDKIEGAG